MATNKHCTDKAFLAQNFKVPFRSEKKSKKILTEDQFSQGISKIIERDFFPDIPKLEAQTEYFEALEKNDLVKLREIQMRFSQRKLNTGAPDSICSPSTFETPQGRILSTPGTTKESHDPDKDIDEMDDIVEDTAVKDTPKLSLDLFLCNNTSEDSASFMEILDESDQKQRLKQAWLFEKEQEQQLEQENMMVVPSIEQQAMIQDKPAHINTWKYVTRNSVMYVPAGVELSPKELIDLQKQKPREIIHENTRFHHNPFSNAKSKEAMQKAASFKALLNQGKIGHDGKEIHSGMSPQVNGYSFAGTPSPSPGVCESPLMTWGEIDSTPARLDNNAEGVVSTPGPVFRMPAVPKRDRLAMELSEKASKAHRAKKEEAIRQVTRRFASPGSKIGLSSSERLNSMSPAAQRLASKRLGIQPSADKALQDSYTPSPSHRQPTTDTPVRLTPSSRRTRLPSSPAISTPNIACQEASLTDHLLNLPKRTRKSAADFF